MCPTTFFSIFVIIAVIAIAYFLVRISFKLEFFRAQGGVLNQFMKSSTVDIEGRQVVLVYRPPKKNISARLEISLTGHFFAHAAFRTETKIDHFGKNIGLNQEIQLFDLDFDKAVYVECEDRDFVNQLLRTPEAKAHLKSILATMTSLHIDGNRCYMVKADMQGKFYSSAFLPAVHSMVAFSKNIPLLEPGAVSATPVTDKVRLWIGFFIGFSGLLFGVGLALIIWGLSAFAPLMPAKLFFASLYIAMPFAFIMVFYMFYRFKGLSIALRSFTTAAIFAILGAVLVCWGGGMVLNGSQDVSEKTAYQVQVMDKYTTHSKNNTSYHIRVNAWREGFSSYVFNVGKHAYYSIDRGDPCTVVSKAGLFGFEWIVSQVCHPDGS
jgi:hypothetical protein